MSEMTIAVMEERICLLEKTIQAKDEVIHGMKIDHTREKTRTDWKSKISKTTLASFFCKCDWTLQTIVWNSGRSASIASVARDAHCQAAGPRRAYAQMVRRVRRLQGRCDDGDVPP